MHTPSLQERLSALVAVGAVAVLLAAPIGAGAVPTPAGAATDPVRQDAERDTPTADAADCDSDLTDCEGPIRPGARMTAPVGCTLNFVVTDGDDLYIGTAGHCVDEGDRVAVNGDEIGTVVYAGAFALGVIDAAFIQIDEDHEMDVDPTMKGWGGPVADVTGQAVEDPVPGETVYYYGHGVGIDDRSRHGEAATPAVPDEAPQPPFLEYEFTFAGWIDHGDSGGPIVTTTGQAAGIISACIVSCSPSEPRLDAGTSFESAMDKFASDLGADLRLVEGGSWHTVDNAETAVQETPDRL